MIMRLVLAVGVSEMFQCVFLKVAIVYRAVSCDEVFVAFPRALNLVSRLCDKRAQPRRFLYVLTSED